MKQLKTRQICFFFIAFMPITKFFMVPSILAGQAHEDMWICSVVNLLLDLFTLTALTVVCKRENTDFITLLKNKLGEKGAKVVLFIYAIYFFTKAFLPLQEQKEFVKLSLYINMPTDLFFLPFFLASFYLCLKPMRVFGRVSDVLWFFTLSGYLILIALSFNNVDWTSLLPVGARGVKNVLKGSYLTANWWGDCVYLMFFIGNFAHGKKASLKIILCYLLSGVIVLFAMIFFWGTFTSIAFQQKFAMTQLSKYTTVINNTGRFDYLGILLILFSCVFGLALPLYFCSSLLQEVFPLKKRWIIPLVVNVLILVLMTALNRFMATVTLVIQNYLSLFFIIMANLLPLFTLLLKNKEKTNENLQT
ncbi:MAG: GerAB/ArcD/ProY family transporter [Clostridia bacterium]|nr:GerAB/ArcD/ProY family transporter [Clostridia bacterium]